MMIAGKDGETPVRLALIVGWIDVVNAFPEKGSILSKPRIAMGTYHMY